MIKVNVIMFRKLHLKTTWILSMKLMNEWHLRSLKKIFYRCVRGRKWEKQKVSYEKKKKERNFLANILSGDGFKGTRRQERGGGKQIKQNRKIKKEKFFFFFGKYFWKINFNRPRTTPYLTLPYLIVIWWTLGSCPWARRIFVIPKSEVLWGAAMHKARL